MKDKTGREIRIVNTLELVESIAAGDNPDDYWLAEICPICGHYHMDYTDEECVSCGCDYAYLRELTRMQLEDRKERPMGIFREDGACIRFWNSHP